MAYIPHRWSKAVSECCHMDDPSFDSSVPHFPNLLSVEGKWFFTHDVLTTFGRSNGLFVMSKIGSRDNDGVNFGIFTDLVEIRRDFLNSPITFALFKQSLAHVAGRNQFGSGIDTNAWYVVIITDGASTNNSNSNRVGCCRHGGVFRV